MFIIFSFLQIIIDLSLRLLSTVVFAIIIVLFYLDGQCLVLYSIFTLLYLFILSRETSASNFKTWCQSLFQFYVPHFIWCCTIFMFLSVLFVIYSRTTALWANFVVGCVNSENGMSPDRCHAIIWTNAGLSLIFYKQGPFCLGLNGVNSLYS